MRKLVILTCFVVALMGFYCSHALASESLDEPRQISLKEAIDMAIDNSNEIKIQEEVTGKAWEQREIASDNVSFIPTGGYAPQAESAYAGLLQADLNHQIQRKEIEDQIDQVALEVYEKYLSIKTLEEKYEALTKAMEEMEWNKKSARAMLNVGLMATTDMVGVDAQYQQAQSELVSVQEELNKAYVELNNYLGLNPEEKLELVDSIPYTPLVVDDLDFDAEKAVNNSVDVWQAVQKITIERKDLSFLSKNYKVEEYDVDIAELSVAEIKNELRKQVRLLYHDIKTLEEAIEAAKQGVKSAKESLRVENMEYEVGMSTEGDILLAEKNVASAEQSLAELKYNHAVAVANYRNLIGKSILPNTSNM